MSGSRPLYALLGFAGLIPFVVPAAMAVTGVGDTALAQGIGEVYALAIIAFLSGSWWGMGLPRRHGGLLLLSNLYFLLALGIYLFAGQWWALAAAALLAVLFFIETGSRWFTDLEPGYRTMRAALTAIAGASMLTLHFAA